jgi:hypothetical protein
MYGAAVGRGGARLHVGFILTTPFQLFHYGAIAKHLDADLTVFVELRDDDFEVTGAAIQAKIPGAAVAWVPSDNLVSIDGQCDVLVCQTPVGALTFFTRSLLVAQQYSLAKESYQYGPWRSQASLNLMYGDYSTNMVSGYAMARSAGNPLLDGHLPVEGLLPAPAQAAPAEKLKLLYMPTYGDLTDRVAVLDALLAGEDEVAVKVHHADFEMRDLAAERGMRVFLSDTHPAEAIERYDCVVSDYSGAIYDALALRKPVVLVEEINESSDSLFRLSEGDRSREAVAELAAFWRPGDPVRGAYESSRSALADDDSYAAFVGRHFSYVGASGAECARAITELAREGESLDFGVQQVRETLRRYITDNRRLRASQKRRGGANGGATARERLGRAIATESPRTLLRKLRRRVRRLPPVERILSSRTGGSGGRTIPARASDKAHAGGQLPVLPRQLREEAGRLVRAAFDSNGVPYRASRSLYDTMFGVRAEDADRAYAALKTLTAPPGSRLVVWTGSGTKYVPLKGIEQLDFSRFAGSDSVVVGLKGAGAIAPRDKDSGAEIVSLELRHGRLVSRRQRLDKVDWTDDFGVDAVATTALAVPPEPLPDEGSVDVVYTWVDSQDEEWARERQFWSNDVEFEMSSAANDERYLARDELRYSIRSVWMYAPFVRNIYIVTSGQRPAWLPHDTERIRVVTHAEIFPDPSVLPTFNSHAIEACLHRIPGLAERFIYFNDDVFLGRETRVEDFFTQAGLIKSRYSPTAFVTSARPSVDAIPTDWASFNAVTLMREDFGLTFERKTKHVPHPLSRGMLEEMDQRYPEVFASTRASRFRAHSDYAVPSMLAQYYAAATHRGVEWPGLSREYVYADTGRKDFGERLSLITKSDPMFFCLNGTLYRDIDLQTQAGLLREFLQARYPEPSPYETT